LPLQTNRLGSIDDAILSRIHLVLEYKDLDQPDRAKIWQQFFKKLTNERENFEVSEYAGEFVENDRRILDLKWNGREIRNGQCALSNFTVYITTVLYLDRIPC